MKSQQLPTRTETGYQLGNLIAEKLPARQAQTLLFCANGFSEKAAAAVMNCSAANVRGLKQALFFKLDAHSGTEAITKAFANAYLRFACLLMTAYISLSAPMVNDHNTIARIGRTRTNNHLRARTAARSRNSNGVYWSPETNQLIWS